MNAEMILKSDVLDILFENRNKNYGAYDLRKFYNNRMKISLVVMAGIVIILCSFTFLPAKEELNADLYTIPNDPALGNVDKPHNDPPKKEPSKKFENKATEAFTTNIIITQDTANVSKLAKSLDSAVIGGVSTAGDPGDGPGDIFTVGMGEQILLLYCLKMMWRILLRLYQILIYKLLILVELKNL